jgi:chemotaxis response regulator CheB
VPNFDVIVIGASAGGVGYLQRVVERLPKDLSAAVFVTLHLPEGAKSVLARILTRAGELPAVAATNGAAIRRGRIYAAPPGFHLTLERVRMRVSRGAREHGHVPAIDARKSVRRRRVVKSARAPCSPRKTTKGGHTRSPLTAPLITSTARITQPSQAT